ncbi:hypothetical protein OV079_23710 [Nannocystis pusilla]|uniref:Uncharacterized protein n=1 Tax=Nannocystis pusilla TaxID=889268 RepID=A0A9X3EH55_9BACT|nr:hypothetical protein [Nannocystis pusilla]MCY1003983.1 hypothetical protein [Nannocystis pusilla]MCY1008509.1 hypothetical protein [Nannocystis pusilla]
MALSAAGLALILPTATTRYVALATAADLLSGSFAELTAPGYSRKAHSAWLTVVGGGEIRRQSNVAIVFDALPAGATGVTWWGIFDAAVAGNLLAAGPLLNLGGTPQPMTFAPGDQPRFNIGDLSLIATPEVV